MTAPRRVAVIGGGLAGLAAAHRVVELARERGRQVEVQLFEARGRVGGTIAIEHSGGFTIEGGADAMLSEKPWGAALCERLGVPLVGTREGERRTFVVHRGRLYPLPEGFLLLAPTNLRALAASPLFSWRGKLRMALDLVLPRGPATADESLAAFVRRRLGREALERVAQPLVGGIYTADPERLSLAATMPRFLETERRDRSLILGLRAAARAAGSAGARYGLFVAPGEGMEALVTALSARLPDGAVHLRAPATGLGRDGSAWRFRAGGEAFAADTVIVATPSHAAAGLLAPLDPELGRLLGAIDYASSATVTLAYRSADVAAHLQGFGFVVPATEGRPLIACTYASRKFPNRAPADHELVRGFVGGALHPEVADLDDKALVALVRRELGELVGIAGTPLLVRVHHHPRAMPQYAVGHLGRVEAIETRLAALPGLALAGAAYRGVGIPDCVRGGEAAAEGAVGAGPARHE